MTQFEVHTYRIGRRHSQLVVDVQTNLLSDLASRLVIPLYPRAPSARLLPRLNPVFSIDSQNYWLGVQDAASVMQRDLSEPITSLAHRRNDIIAALDLLLTGV